MTTELWSNRGGETGSKSGYITKEELEEFVDRSRKREVKADQMGKSVRSRFREW